MSRDWFESCGPDSEGAERLKEDKVSKFRVGDRVSVVKNNSNSINEVGDVGVIVATGRMTPRLKVNVQGRKESCNWHEPSDLMMIESGAHTIQLNHQYTSKNGNKWECIGIKDGIAFLSSGGEGDAYRFLLNGENLSQGGGLWDIQWEPVVEWASFAIKHEGYGQTHYGTLKYPVIDGVPDFTQATVTPV